MSGILVVSGCDDHHHGLAADLIASLNATRDGSFDIGFVNIDDGARGRELQRSVDRYATIASGADGGTLRGYKIAFMKLKARLPSLFPGYGTYVWLDGDTWVQNAAGIRNAVRAAAQADIAIHPELDTHYVNARIPSDRTLTVYASLFPNEKGQLWRYAMVNSGVFAARADSKLWTEWNAVLDAILARHAKGEQIFFSDQIPLHYLIVTGRLTMRPLRAVDNWLVYAATPSLHAGRKKVVAPSEPYEDINILHLAGVSKDHTFNEGNSSQPLNFTYSGIKEYFSRS